MKIKQIIYLTVGLAGICMLFAGQYWMKTEYALAIGFAFLIFAIQGISRRVETQSPESENLTDTPGLGGRTRDDNRNAPSGSGQPDSKE